MLWARKIGLRVAGLERGRSHGPQVRSTGRVETVA
jgi:hypothetical protein